MAKKSSNELAIELWVADNWPKKEQRAVKDEKIILIQMFLFFVLFLVIALVRNASHTLHHTKKKKSFAMIWLFHSPGTFHPTASAHNEQWNHFYSMKLCGEQKILTIPKIIWHLNICEQKRQLQCCKLRPNAIAPFFAMHFL